MATVVERDMRQEWETPDDFFDVVNAEFDFQIDVCATKDNAKCDIYHSLYDYGVDSLNHDTSWLIPDIGRYRAWCNPGFANPGPWMEKAYREAQKHEDAVVAVMGLISPSTEWWRKWGVSASEIRLIGGRRIQFKPPPGIAPSSNSRENALFIFTETKEYDSSCMWTWDWTKDEEG